MTARGRTVCGIALLALELLAAPACRRRTGGGFDDDPQDPPADDDSAAACAAEACDGLDNDCDGAVDELDPDGAPWLRDGDGDGFSPCLGDCDDADGQAFPGQIESCNGRDDDCDGASPGEGDEDGDGVPSCADCGPFDPGVSPAVDEVLWNQVDDDCDGWIDEMLGIAWDTLPVVARGEDLSVGMGLASSPWDPEHPLRMGHWSGWVALPAASTEPVTVTAEDGWGPWTSESLVGEGETPWLQDAEPTASGTAAWLVRASNRLQWIGPSNGGPEAVWMEEGGAPLSLQEVVAAAAAGEEIQAGIGPLLDRGPDLDGDGQVERLLAGHSSTWWILGGLGPPDAARVLPLPDIPQIGVRDVDILEVLPDCDLDGDGLGDLLVWYSETLDEAAQIAIYYAADFPDYSDGPERWFWWCSGSSDEPCSEPQSSQATAPWRTIACAHGIELFEGQDGRDLLVAAGWWPNMDLALNFMLFESPPIPDDDVWEFRVEPPRTYELTDFTSPNYGEAEALCSLGDANGDGADDFALWSPYSLRDVGLLSGREVEAGAPFVTDALAFAWSFGAFGQSQLVNALCVPPVESPPLPARLYLTTYRWPAEGGWVSELRRAL